jgi:hypothetical protein
MSALAALDVGTVAGLWRLRRRIKALEARHSAYGTNDRTT